MEAHPQHIRHLSFGQGASEIVKVRVTGAHSTTGRDVLERVKPGPVLESAARELRATNAVKRDLDMDSIESAPVPLQIRL